MSVIALYSPKGGVGKSTIAVDLAWRCAVLGGYRTLLWDLDTQGGASYLLGLDADGRERAASAFHRDTPPGQLASPTPYTRLGVIGADASLRTLPLQLARIGRRKRLARLTDELQRDFDRIIIDAPAGQNEVTDQIIAGADVLIVPLPPSPLSARALDLLRADLTRHHRRHPPILPVLSMFDSRRKIHREARSGAMAAYPVVPYSSAIEHSAVLRAPVGSFSRHGEGAQALDRLWRAIEAKLGDLAGKGKG